MKLHREEVRVLDQRREFDSVRGGGTGPASVGNPVAVHKVVAGRLADEPARSRKLDIVPPHMRFKDLRGAIGSQRGHRAWQNTEAIDVALLRVLEEQLHAE